MPGLFRAFLYSDCPLTRSTVIDQMRNCRDRRTCLPSTHPHCERFICGVAAAFSSAEGSMQYVTICGQTRQAALPSWRNQRQSGRIRQGGSDSTTAGINCTRRVARRQSVPSKWQHALSWHGAANRSTCVGATGAARASKSPVTGTGFSIQATRGFPALPATTPKATLPAMSGCALGQRTGLRGSEFKAAYFRFFGSKISPMIR